MIENCSVSHPEIASWSDAGDTVLIYSPTQLEQHYLPQYFQHNKFPSFVRQLNLYGFKNVTKELTTGSSSSSVGGSHNSGGSGSGTSGSGLQAFRNPNFLRGRKDLVFNIQRSKTGDRAQRKTKQEEAVRAVSEELGGRLDELESHVSILNRKADDISGKLDMVIHMLASAGIGSAPPQADDGRLSYTGGMDVTGMGGVMPPPQDMGGLPRQMPPLPPSVLNNSLSSQQDGNVGNSGNGSQVEINGWLGTVQAGQKRDRNSSTQDTSSVRKLPKRHSDEGKKFISSEGSMSSSGESDHGQNDSNQKHMFYDLATGERLKSPLTGSGNSELPDPSCEELELDPKTSSILMNLTNESVEGDPELGRSGTSASGIEPIPFDSEDIELPDIILAGDDQPLNQGDAGAAGVSPGQGANGAERKSFLSRNRNFLVAGLMLTAVAAAVGAGLSTQAKNERTPQKSAGVSDAPPLYDVEADQGADFGVPFEEDIVEAVGGAAFYPDQDEYDVSDAIPSKIDVAGLLPPTDATEGSALKEGAASAQEPDRGGGGGGAVVGMITPPPTGGPTMEPLSGEPTFHPTAEPT